MGNKDVIKQFLLLCLVFLVVVVALPAMADAQTHGGAIAKDCRPVTRVCDNNLDCDDGKECTEDICDTTVPNTLRCIIEVSYNDGWGDDILIMSVEDTLETAAGDIITTNPDIISVSGNTTCAVGSFPGGGCIIGPGPNPADPKAGGGAVTFVVEGYNPTLADYNLRPDHKLPDDAVSRVRDLCNGNPEGQPTCDPDPNDLPWQATSPLERRCNNDPSPDSTPCTDTGNACFLAGCEAGGVCNQ
ncbi:MAG: hypothetical protein GTO60_03380, partial [Gammaproteobacteria bacterium]|nr:hypothetical protein [Gammaproteobacteria bacterium]